MPIHNSAGNKKILIVNADDFGLTHTVNKGILKCFNDGIVTSASILTNEKAFKESVEMTKSNNLNVGIHLTLMDGLPVSSRRKISSLIDGKGCFPINYTQFSTRFFSGRISLKEVETEFRAQIEKFLNAGLEPKHINGHNHVHMYPGIVNVIIRLMMEYEISTIRLPSASVINSWDGFSFTSLSKLFLVVLTKFARQKVIGQGLRTTDYFEGLFVSGRLTKDEILKLLPFIKPGVTELMCHPGFADDDLRLLHPWNYLWEEELAALCDREVMDRVDNLGIELKGF